MGWIFVIIGCVLIAKAAFSQGQNSYRLEQKANEEFEKRVMNIVNKNRN